MRRARAFLQDGSQAGFYHCLSRVVDRRFIMGDPEKETFRRILRQCETFYGLKVLTYCIMSNHFHLLVLVPEPKELDEGEILERVAALYSPKFVAGLRSDLDAFRQRGLEDSARDLLASFTRRMWNLSNFMKSLKQRFSSFYNRNHDRSGTLWEERFRSILVEGEDRALLTMALYIDLNPIRAGIVTDPAEYRFCGYGEAVGGGEAAREGLRSLVSWRVGSWKTVQAEYRRLLYSTGEETTVRRGFTREEAAAVEAREGHLPAGAILRHRIRHFSEGVILGSRSFIDAWLQRNRWRFGERSISSGSDRRLPDLARLGLLRAAPA
ncbi:MAG: transposase [Thermoanaerobaculia bacterium]|nr:transposase [Thermoanaerobaculia bacterium]